MRHRETGRYIKCENCSYVGDTKKMQSHNDMGCLRRAMGQERMAECASWSGKPSPKAPVPDRKF